MLRPLLMVLVLLWPAAAFADLEAHPEKAGFSPEDVASLDSLLDSLVKRGLVAGGVAVAERNDVVGYSRAFGTKSLGSDEPLPSDTIFRIYSMTKPVTSAAVMMLYDDGKFELDDPVAKYLPELADMKVGVEKRDDSGKEALDLVEANHPPTVRELLSHTAGLAYGLTRDSQVDRLYAESNLMDMSETLEAKIKRIGTLPLKHQPGSIWDYSIATDVLGRLVEVLSGQSLDVFFRGTYLRTVGHGGHGIPCARGKIRPIRRGLFAVVAGWPEAR